MEEYTLEVAVVVAFPVEAAVAASLAGVVDVGWSAVEALEAQAADLCYPVKVHPEVAAPPAHLYRDVLNVRKDRFRNSTDASWRKSFSRAPTRPNASMTLSFPEVERSLMATWMIPRTTGPTTMTLR